MVVERLTHVSDAQSVDCVHASLKPFLEEPELQAAHMKENATTSSAMGERMVDYRSSPPLFEATSRRPYHAFDQGRGLASTMANLASHHRGLLCVATVATSAVTIS
jgi:hypothetical protein